MRYILTILLFLFLSVNSFSQGAIRAVIQGSSEGGATPPPPVSGGDSYEWATLKAAPSQMGHGAEDFNWTGTTCIGYWTNSANTITGSYNAGGNYYSGTLKYLMQQSCKMWIIPRITLYELPALEQWTVAKGYKDNKYIVGALAPFPGIVVYGDYLEFFTNNLVVRGVSFNYGTGGNPGQYNAVGWRNASYGWFADMTGMHGPDEIFSSDNFRWLIVQNNLFLEGYQGHNTGSIFSSDLSVYQVQPLSVYDNYYIHLTHRFPNSEIDDNDPADIINNGSWIGNGRLTNGRYGHRYNMMNNVHYGGSRSNFMWNSNVYDAHSAIQMVGGTEGFAGRYDDLEVYIAGNIVEGRISNEFADNKPFTSIQNSHNGYTSNTQWPSHFFRSPFEPWPFGTDALFRRAVDAWDYNIINKNVGSRYYTNSSGSRVKYILPYTDAYLNDAINRSMSQFRNTSTGAEYTLAAMSLPSTGGLHVDSDFDGMPDAWETAHGLNVGVQDHDSVKAIWVIDGIEWSNTAGYTNMQVCADDFHGGLLRLKSRIDYQN